MYICTEVGMKVNRGLFVRYSTVCCMFVGLFVSK